jgi:hypothetical protein
VTVGPGRGGRHRKYVPGPVEQPAPPPLVIHGHTGSVRWREGQIVVSGLDGGQLTAPVDAVSGWLVDVPRGGEDDIELNLLAELGGSSQPSARTFARVLVCFPAAYRVRLQGFLELLRIEQASRRLNAPVPVVAPRDKAYPALPVGTRAPGPTRPEVAADDEWVVFHPLTDITGLTPPNGGRAKQSP